MNIPVIINQHGHTTYLGVFCGPRGEFWVSWQRDLITKDKYSTSSYPLPPNWIVLPTLAGMGMEPEFD